MPCKADFNASGKEIKFPTVVGYRISANFTLGSGFQSQFYIYLVEEQLAKGKLHPVSIPDSGLRGTLSIGDDSRSYVFENIDLLSVEPAIDQKHRRRVIEFRLDAAITDKGLKATTTFHLDTTVPDGDLGKDYTYSPPESADASAPGGPPATRNLLGFRCRQAATESAVYRLASLRGSAHSWLKSLLDASGNGATKNARFHVGFAQAPSDLVVEKNTTSRFLVDESWGVCNDWPLPALAELALPPEQRAAPRIAAPAETPRTLVKVGFGEGDYTVDVATIVYNPRNYHNLPVA